MAYSCLYIQLCAYQEMKMTPYLLSDDATEDELTELAAEQRAIARETPGTIAATLFMQS